MQPRLWQKMERGAIGRIHGGLATIGNKKLNLFLQLSQKQYPVFLKTNLKHFQSHSPTGKDGIHDRLFHKHANFVYGDNNEIKIMKILGQTSPPFD